jgi:hypothetical protein
MTESISPAQLQDLLAGYVLYDLSPEEAATLAELLAANPDLQQDIDQLQQTLELAYDGDPVSAPESLKKAVMQAAIAAAAPTRPAAVPVPAPEPSGPARRWGRLWGAAAAALIAGLSLSNLMLWRTLQVERASRLGEDTLTIALGSADDLTPAQAQVVINPDTLVGSLTVENLPPLEPGSVYVLWTVVDPNAAETLDDKDAILTTVFTVDDQGRVSQPIDLPPVYRRDRSLVRAVAITKESAAAPQAHLSAPILIQPL